MDNIIIFHNYSWKKGEIMRLEELQKDLIEKNKVGYEYTLSEIRKITNDILSMISTYTGRCATPIVKIAKLFDFRVYKEALNESGDININGETAQKYGHDKIILVNNEDELFHQRFVAAHELAHYLFDFLGNPEYAESNIQFVDTYKKDRHETLQEKRASTFAAELMMPQELFIKQYNIARSEESNHMFIVLYLSKYFEMPVDSIERRITEVSR